MSEAGAESSNAVISEGTSVTVKLTESDIPGASLSEPLETHTIPELKWWFAGKSSSYLKVYMFVCHAFCTSFMGFYTIQNP